MQSAYVLTGTVSDSRTLNLDEELPLHTGRVRVVVEPIEPAAKMSHDEFLTWLRQRQQARGHVPPTRQEIDSQLQAERDSWDK